MSLARKQAVVSGSAWLLVAVCFVVIVADSGVAALASPAGERTRTVLGTIILPGYLINFAIYWRMRRGRREGDLDERDEAIERRATEFTAIFLLLAVFLFSIGLFDAHAEAGSAPAGWFYVLAYGTIVTVSLLHPIARLVLDLSGRVHG